MSGVYKWFVKREGTGAGGWGLAERKLLKQSEVGSEGGKEAYC